MSKDQVHTAVAYYTAMKNKDVAGMKKCLHPDVQFNGPLGKLKGREAVLQAAEKFMILFKDFIIRSKFDSDNQVMLVYTLVFPAPIGNFPAATRMSFQEELISELELFYDATPFQKKKEEIFS